jgi:hypothetical protein
MLYEQQGRLALLSDEGAIFELLAGRYSKTGQPNLENFLGSSGFPVGSRVV